MNYHYNITAEVSSTEINLGTQDVRVFKIIRLRAEFLGVPQKAKVKEIRERIEAELNTQYDYAKIITMVLV